MPNPSHALRPVLVLSMSSALLALPASTGWSQENGREQTYMPVVIEGTFGTTQQRDSRAKPDVMKRQKTLLSRRYDLGDRPSDLKMSAGRKAVQAGVRVKLPEGTTWAGLASMTPQRIREKGLFPKDFLPLPHAKHPVGGMVFPGPQIDGIRKQEGRSLKRFDVEFDLPQHLLPEFPPPIFLTSRPDLGDVSQGKLLAIKNYYEIMHGILTPVQMEGLRLLLMPFPQQQFNQTEDRRVAEPSLGVSCLDCHANDHTNAAFHLNPDTRPRASRFRIDTVSLRGMFNQQIHGSKRSLRSVEDFTEFEQRTAYFDGDHAAAAKKGVNLPNRSDQVSMADQDVHATGHQGLAALPTRRPAAHAGGHGRVLRPRARHRPDGRRAGRNRGIHAPALRPARPASTWNGTMLAKK